VEQHGELVGRRFTSISTSNRSTVPLMPLLVLSDRIPDFESSFVRFPVFKAVVVLFVIHASLLKITDKLIEGFEIKGFVNTMVARLLI